MPKIHSLALCLSERELADFLPEPLLAECRLARTCRVVETPGLDAGGFAERLRVLDPDVVVGEHTARTVAEGALLLTLAALRRAGYCGVRAAAAGDAEGVVA